MNQRGVSLIELMVSMVLGLFLVAGAITIYLQSSTTYRTSDTAARMQEVGRYALDIVEPDVRLAGFYGLAARPDMVENTVADATISPNCGANWIGDSALSIDARDGGIDLSSQASCTTPNRVTGSDILIVRRASSATTALDDAKVQVQSTRMRAVIFKTATPVSVPSGMPVSPASETRNLVVDAYYVAQPTAGTYSLRRRALSGTSFGDEEVIPGIQDFQVQFGVDQNGDGSADQYVNPGSVGSGQVVSARIWLMVVSEDFDPELSDAAVYAYANRNFGSAFTDKRRRLVMTKTIQIRNSKP